MNTMGNGTGTISNEDIFKINFQNIIKNVIYSNIMRSADYSNNGKYADKNSSSVSDCNTLIYRLSNTFDHIPR